MTTKLTKREKEILCLSCFTCEEIYEKLHICPSTTKTHRTNIYGKLIPSLYGSKRKHTLLASALITALDKGVITLDEIVRRENK